MCYIVKAGSGGSRFNADKGIIPHTFEKGNWMQVHQKIKLKCIHPDGRSDTYLLEPGQRLVVDETAELEILTIYPKEQPQEEIIEVPTPQPQSSPPEPISVPAGSPG